VFSFHPRKIISTGDGGMITTPHADWNAQFKLLRQHGMSVPDTVRHGSNTVIFESHPIVGFNYRMTDIQAAVGIQQLAKLDWIVGERRKIAQRYLNELSDIDCIRLPREEEGYFTNWQSFSIYLKECAPLSRNELMQALLDKGVASRRGVMTSHRETAYKTMCAGLELPQTEDACDRSIIIPLFVPMSDEDVSAVIHQLRSLLV
jgi:dTDP-4-amino-4,6-dideoxygalactose transaminase